MSSRNILYFFYVIRKNPITALGLVIIVSFVFIAIFAPYLAPYDPYETNPDEILNYPSWSHPFGTDEYGRDIISRIFYGARIDLSIAVSSVLMAALMGSIIGGAVGYIGKIVDEITMRIMDVLLAFPSFILALGLMVALGAGIENLIISQTFVRIPIFTRTVRGQMLSVKQNEYADAAKVAGNSAARIIFYHLLPNCITPLIVLITLNFGYAILRIAALSFLGVGIKPPTAEWGIMVSYGAPYILHGKWWVSFFPGLFIALTVLGFNLVGDGLRDIYEKRAR